MVNGRSKWNLPSASFAYHLHKPLKNRFLRVNGKRPLRQERSWRSFFFHSKTYIVLLSLLWQLCLVETFHIIFPVSNALKKCSLSYQGNASGNHSGTKASTSERNTEPEMQENRHFNDPSPQINLVYAKTTPGSYCHHNYYQQTSAGDWNPEPINGILIQEGKQLLSLKLALQFIVNINIAMIHFNFKLVIWHAVLIQMRVCAMKELLVACSSDLWGN